jgi:Fe-S cluster assembly protein SufD
MSLGRALQEAAPQVEAAMRETGDDDRSFTALNAAFAASGAFIEIDAGTVIDEPLQLLFISAGQPAAVMAHPRNIVSLGAGARLRLIESHVAVSEGASLTNLVSQIRLGPGAVLEHDRLQLGLEGTSHIGKGYIELSEESRYTQTAVSLGGGLVRNESEIRLGGENADCRMNGAFMPRGVEQVDTLIRIRHAVPNCHSDQFYKGVIDDRAHAVFAGKIIVDRDAQKTNAFQKNDNLLLSDDAEIDSKPELEIYADDVRCSHGATVGELDARALFYLRSRGIGSDLARSILTFAFAAEAIDRFADPALRRQARHAAAARLPGGSSLQDIE